MKSTHTMQKYAKNVRYLNERFEVFCLCSFVRSKVTNVEGVKLLIIL